MTLHVSLPEELENRVHNEVKSGMYGSASEVVREALRQFFSREDELTPREIAWLRKEMQHRTDRLKSGESQWIDGESFFKDMEQRYG